MRRRLVLVALVVLVALAGCAETFENDPGDSIEETSGGDTQQPADEGSGEDPGKTDPTPGTLEVHHIDVGQAGATLVVTPEEETILVDTGDWQSDGEGVITYLEEHGIERIDHLVATHPHADHIGGHAAVIEYFEEEAGGIGALYDPGQPHDTQTYENYLDAVDAYGHELLLVEEGDKLPLDSGSVEALVLNPPAGDTGGDLHRNAMSLAIEFGDVRYLLTGDIESTGEARLVEEWAEELDADIYQAGHHGSSTSSTERFLDAVDPEVAVVSSGYDSQFGHPHDEVLERFAERDVETYWTGVHGDVVVTTDGVDIDVTPGAAFSTDPMDLLAEKPGGGRVAQRAAVSRVDTRPARRAG
ncbi:MAG: competence protein ComEC [Halovenus sp.]|jgi:competence protein ComEC